MSDTSFYDHQYDQILATDHTNHERATTQLRRTVAYTASESGYHGPEATPAALILLGDAAHRRGHQDIAEALISFSANPHEWEQQ